MIRIARGLAAAVFGLALCAPAPARAQDSAPQPAAPAADGSEQQLDGGPLPLELRPYRVLVSVGFDPDPRLDARFRADVLQRLADLADRTAGGMWNLRVIEDRSLFPANRSGLERFSAADVAGRLPGPGFDKAYLLAVTVEGPRYVVCGREWDAAGNRLGPVAAAAAGDRRALAEAAFRLIDDLFSPVLAVADVDAATSQVRLTLQAGALVERPPAEQPADVPEEQDAPREAESAAGALTGGHDRVRVQVVPGDVVVPFLRYLDRDGDLRDIQFLPWTYLMVEEVTGDRVVCAQVTGVRVPLGTGRRRVEAMGLSLRRLEDSTRLRLVPRGNVTRPLVGHSVRVDYKTSYRDEPQSEPLRLSTDRAGEITIPADRSQPIAWLYVNSGEALLGRVPFVPGLEPFAVLELPDDSLRLAAEGEIEVLKGRLVDTVARRAALLARARGLARQEKWDEADRQVALLDELPGIREFQSQLNLIRTPAVRDARERNDRAAEARIRRLCDDADQLIQRYLDPDRVRQAKEELEELRAAASGG